MTYLFINDPFWYAKFVHDFCLHANYESYCECEAKLIKNYLYSNNRNNITFEEYRNNFYHNYNNLYS